MGGDKYSSLEEKAAAEGDAAPVQVAPEKTLQEKVEDMINKFKAELLALIKG